MTFADSLRLSPLASSSENWVTSPELSHSSLPYEPDIFLNVISHLIAHPNLNTSHLFRADILHDSARLLQTPEDKERELLPCTHAASGATPATGEDTCVQARAFPLGLELKRTVVRRSIPRNQKLDRQLDQTCHFYADTASRAEDMEKTQHAKDIKPKRETHLVVYTPHVSTQDELPWYYPTVRAIAFLYDFESPSGSDPQQKQGCGTLSLHFLPFYSPGIPNEIPYRLQRTLLGMLSTPRRMMRGTAPNPSARTKPKPYKDNIIPQHTLQNTYMRLKDKYAKDLIANWVEPTEPSKHVYEDINIAAFLVELWRLMYSVGTAGEKEYNRSFPGFVDIACGNGVLTHILLSEGYQGWGFDARRRKTWDVFPSSTQERLKETVCIPKPFKDTLDVQDPNFLDISVDETHNGIFTKDTFIISNHADELTVWTPLVGMLSNPSSPLPFLAIPCCSHALSGARFRYPPPKKVSSKKGGTNPAHTCQDQQSPAPELDPQPAEGDLKTFRASKQQAQEDLASVSSSSSYGCLTEHVVRIAGEVGYDVEKTMLRIPSTRNVGVIGGLKRWKALTWGEDTRDSDMDTGGKGTREMEDTIQRIVERESARDGSVEGAAKLWAERSLGLQKGQGRGKLKGGAQHG